MDMVLSTARLVGLTLASAAAGMLLCLVLWHVFKLVRHPEWGPPLIVVPIALAFTDRLPDSEFLRRSLVFAAIGAGPFWIAGIAWRAALRDQYPAVKRLDATPGPESSDPMEATRTSCRYPAITRCISEDRRPSPGEVKRVALRIWREALAARDPTPSFAQRRIALRAARAALEGRPA